MSRWLQWACFALLLVSASAASAQSNKDLVYGRDGFAVGFYGLAGFSPGGTVVEGREDIALSNAVGPGFSVEYRFHQMFSAELMAETINRDIYSEVDPAEQFRIWTMTANARIYLSPGRLQPFLLAGFGFGTGSDTSLIPDSGGTSPAVRVGGGADFYFTDHIVGGFSIEMPVLFTPLSNFDYLKIGFGMKYRF